MSDKEASMKLWTLKELAESGPVRKSVTTWRRMIANGQIRVKRVGAGRGMIYIEDSEIRKMTTND